MTQARTAQSINIQQVCVLVKPDGMSKGIFGTVMDRFALAGLQLDAAQVVEVTPDLAKEHYRHLRNKSFYPELMSFLTGKITGAAGVLALVYSGKNAVAVSRRLAGATNPEEAGVQTIRGAYGRITSGGVFENVIHVSSDASEAEREIKLWFSAALVERNRRRIKKQSRARA